jgi:hypothetical protein
MTLESPSLKNSTSRDVSAGECRHHVVPELEYHAAGYRDFLDCYPSIAALAAQKSGGKPLPRFPSLSHPCLSAGEKKATVPAALCAGMLMNRWRLGMVPLARAQAFRLWPLQVLRMKAAPKDQCFQRGWVD